MHIRDPPPTPPCTTRPPQGKGSTNLSLPGTLLLAWGGGDVCPRVGVARRDPPSPCPSIAEHLSVLELLQDKWVCFDEIRSRALPWPPPPPTQAAMLRGGRGGLRSGGHGRAKG